MKIIRVFPNKTSYTPDDDMAFIGEPPALLIPPHDEVHISCTFTWNMEYCEWLKFQWEMVTDKPVKLGGPAYGSPCDTFTPGLYVKQGIIFTSRGCNNNCPHCFVHKREGALKELPIVPGNIIQDNNFLQCSRAHKDRVFEMLKSQHGICFKGGLQANLIDSHFIENVRQLNIKELWLACDSSEAIPGFLEAAEKLTKVYGFVRYKLKCYVLIGDDMTENENRLKTVYNAGFMPFAQLYQPAEGKKWYSPEWHKFNRQWSRPAAIEAHCKRGTDMHDYNL